MRNGIRKRSVVISGRKTSVSVEDEYWSSLKEISVLKGLTVTQLLSQIDADRSQENFSSAIRIFVLRHYKSLLRELGAGQNSSSLSPLSCQQALLYSLVA